MNTSEVAKLLGVSKSTIKRWVKQLELPLGRNDRGHYIFSEEDIDLLKKIQEQITQGILIQDALQAKEKRSRIGVVMTEGTEQRPNKLIERMDELERNLRSKADDIVSYQILQHRREIEDLQNEVENLTKRLQKVEALLEETKKTTEKEKPIVSDQAKLAKRKKKNSVISFFGF